jgi:hypothetical protein
MKLATTKYIYMDSYSTEFCWSLLDSVENRAKFKTYLIKIHFKIIVTISTVFSKNMFPWATNVFFMFTYPFDVAKPT